MLKAYYFVKVEDVERALDSFVQVIEKSVGVDNKLDIIFIVIQTCFK